MEKNVPDLGNITISGLPFKVEACCETAEGSNANQLSWNFARASLRAGYKIRLEASQVLGEFGCESFGGCRH